MEERDYRCPTCNVDIREVPEEKQIVFSLYPFSCMGCGSEIVVPGHEPMDPKLKEYAIRKTKEFNSRQVKYKTLIHGKT